MGSITRRTCFVILAATSLAAWMALVIGGREVLPPALCATGAFWTAPLPTSLDLLLVLGDPTTAVCGAALMVAAMMLPLISAPLQHVHDRSFARRRGRAMLLFAVGYTILWICAASGLQLLALGGHWIAPTSLVYFVVAAAALWQASPGKQWCLNRCHRRPQLAAFGVAADRDALVYGLTHGAVCAGACWGLMLLPLSVGSLHLPLMAVVALFAAAERVERPAPLAWQWRWPGRALRIAAAQLRLTSWRLGCPSPCFRQSAGDLRPRLP